MATKSTASAAATYLTSLQSWQLRHLCTHLGISAETKKSATAAALVASALSTVKANELRSAHGKRSQHVRSVDMGVKNLAYCLLAPREGKEDAWFRIRDWQRINVVTGESTTAREDGEESYGTSDTGPTLSSYSPANLAPVAARLAARLATEMDPVAILIERQRFRSMGGSAVQEWTLRVNSFEAMIWASLQTLRNFAVQGGDQHFPDTVEMNPARIAAYWNTRGSDWSLEAADTDGIIPSDLERPRKKTPDEESAAVKRGMEKSEKISLVRHWLENGAIDVDKQLHPLANAFMTAGRARKEAGVLVVGKKDDLADCVVQGVTFGVWSRNRQTLAHRLSQEVGDLD